MEKAAPQPVARLRIHVAPRSKREEISEIRPGGVISVRITAPPVDGVANVHLIAFLAEVLGLKRRAVRITHGESSREKTVEVLGMSQKDAEKTLGAACRKK
jgi:uncharacterized protein (TIGR00251 family)